MRWMFEALMKIWPVNRLLMWIWRHMPFPKGARSRIMRSANDWFMVGVIAVIFDDREHVLLVRNTYDPAFEWSLPGGWMGRHENPAECIIRELREETGYQVAVEDLLNARSNRKLPSVDLVFRASIVGGDFRSSAEVTEARFFDPCELPDGVTPVHRRLVQDLTVRVTV